MSPSKIKEKFTILNPAPEHFLAIQELCRRVYPFSKPWSLAQLEAHYSYFREGQFVVMEESSGKLIGLAFSLIISWDDYSPYDNWTDFTSAGFFHNHNPRKGKTLYGAEVMVDPEYRGRGIAKELYAARRELARRFNLKRIRAGARLVGYSKFKDTLSPEEYTQKVINKEIFDPTLSFQLGQGFVVLDVAKNYLLNDPESLGYAAVIEWLNTEVAGEKDLKLQKQSIESFMTNQNIMIEHLPMELRRIVRKMTRLLGEVIREYEGDRFYERIEQYRRKLKQSRNDRDTSNLAAIAKKLNSESKDQQLKVAHAFSLLLEIMNLCESAYRTWRQRQKPVHQPLTKKVELNFVLTAHPTEARHRTVVEILGSLTDLLVEGLNNNFVFNELELSSKFRMLWLHPLVKSEAPTVNDEADYMYSLVFAKAQVDFLLSVKTSYDLNLRTWVGGDKDGHPGVDHVAMRDSMSASRKHLVAIVAQKLAVVLADIEKLKGVVRGGEHEKLRINRLISSLRSLEEVKAGDGRKIGEWRTNYQAFRAKSSPFVKKHHYVQQVSKALDLFPALILPLELREDAGEMAKALAHPTAPIRMMLGELARISDKSDITFYVRGLVISNCEAAADMSTANSLVFQSCKTQRLPIIPLFESAAALRNGPGILTEWLKERANSEQVRLKWAGKLEIMLGYSDSAKQMGVLPSRHLIRNSMFEIENTLKGFGIQPVFFHGSGGSVARGGGSLREQIAWWPDSAIQLPKLTIQGEMIQRIFATKEILNSQCLHLSNEARLRKSRKAKIEKCAALDKLAAAVNERYRLFVSDSELLTFCLEATPYNYLSVLKIGSRPAKRPSAVAELASLRAIPWVLCWTQARLLLPTWWGVGTAWESLTGSERSQLTALFTRDPFFSSYVKALGFTLAKVELGIWDRYLLGKHGTSVATEQASALFHKEFRKALKFAKEVSQSKQLIAHKPWLEESIRLRAPYVHILNLLQINAMRENNEPLLKETLVGIACGMLTTG